MRPVPIVALMAFFGGCAAALPPPEMVPMKKVRTAADQGVTRNPVRYEGPPRGRARTPLQALREANLSAERSVLDGYFTGAVVHYRWRPGEVYKAILAKNRTTTLVLQPGEAYNNAVFGDDRFFGLAPTWAGSRDTRGALAGPAATQVPIVAFEAGRCTDLAVYTTWRTVLLDLCSNGTRGAYNKAIAWTFPEDERALIEQGMAAVPMDAATGVPVDQLESRYEIKGPARFRPSAWTVLNDRKRTYLVPPPDLGFFPVPYIVASEGGNTAQYEVKPQQEGAGSYYVLTAPKLPSQIALQHGRDVMTIRRVR